MTGIEYASIKTLEPSSADRILSAVGGEACPTNVDRDALLRGLSLCAEWYREAQRFVTDVAIKQERERLASISKSTQRLLLLLEEDDANRLYDWYSLVRRLRHRKVDPTEPLQKLLSLVESDLHKQEKDGASKAYIKSFRKRSAFEWLVGYWLPIVYIQLEFANPGSTKAFLASDGPVVAFIEAVLKELNITKVGRPYSRAAIVKALGMPLSKRVSHRVRRKGADDEDFYQSWRIRLMRNTLYPAENPEPEVGLVPITQSEYLKMMEDDARLARQNR